MKKTIKLNVTNQTLTIDKTTLVSQTKNVYECEWKFSEEWDGLGKTAVFFLEGEDPVEVVIGADNKCSLPLEAVESKGRLYVGVYGSNNSQRYPTIYSQAIIVLQGCEEADSPASPTQSVYDQLMAKYLEQIQAVATEKARAQGIESNLATALSQEVTTRGNKDTQLENAIASEKARAIARENEIEARIPSHDNFATKEDVLNEKARAEGVEANKVDKEEGKGLFSGDYNDLTNKPTIPTVPTNVSAFTNDVGYLTEHQSLDGYATETWVENKGYVTEAYHDSSKQDTISDLETIRTGASLGATALQEVPSGYATETWVENKGYVTNAYHDSTKQDVLTQQDKQAIADLKDISGKVDKVDGMGLSHNDFTDNDKQDISTLKQTIVNKQDKLVAGENITIASDGKTISATGVGYFTIIDGKLNILYEGE